MRGGPWGPARGSLPMAADQDAPRFPQRFLELGEPPRQLDLMEQVIDRALQPDQYSGPVAPRHPRRDRLAALLHRRSAFDLGAAGPSSACLRVSRRSLGRPDALPRLLVGRALACLLQIPS